MEKLKSVSLDSAMRLPICFLSHLALVMSVKFSMPKAFSGIGSSENYEKIREIFHKSSIVSVLLRNYEQPEGVISWLEMDVFGKKNKTFVVFNFASFNKHEEWIDSCIEYLQDPSRKTTYYERVYQKTNPKIERISNLHIFDDFEPEADPQAPVINAITMEKNQEKFANGLDKWWKFSYGGYILFCQLDTLDFYVGCLVNRAGTFLIIIDEDIGVESESFMTALNATFHKSWRSTNNLKLHILIDKKVFTFNPFERTRVNGTSLFGAVKLFENLMTEDELKRINGYPLFIDIFWSAFSISTSNFTSYELKSFKGPDIDVTRMIGKQINATSK